MRKLYYIFVGLIVIILGVEFHIPEKEILKRLQGIIDKIEKRKELILWKNYIIV